MTPTPLISDVQFNDLSNVQEAMLEILDFERQRIALDLHDRVQNNLRLIRDDYAHDRGLFEALSGVLQDVRTVAYQLTPKMLQEFSLVEYLNIYESNLNLIYGEQFNTDFRTNVDFYIPKSIENQLFSIVQECMNNVLKYGADTPIVCIRLRKEGEMLTLLVQDFGKGFDKTVVNIDTTVGLRSIATRSNFIGGTCEITTAPSEGCKVKVFVPMQLVREAAIPSTYQATTKVRDNTPKAYPTDNILIVDNQREIGEGLCALLHRTGRTIKYVRSMAEAKTHLAGGGVKVVITDITMPDESGMQLAEHIQDKYEDTKCILYSVNDNPAYIFRAANKLLVDAYIWKEEPKTADDIHPIEAALLHLEDSTTGEPHYSPQIEKVRKTLVERVYKDEESENRKIFGAFIKTMRENERKKDEKIGDYKYRISELALESIGKKSKDVQKYVEKAMERYNEDTQIDKRHEADAFILQLAHDFGLLN